MAGARLRQNLGSMLRRNASRVDLESLMVSMVREFGGPEMLAHEYKKLYDLSIRSPMTQQKILLMVQQLIHATTIHNLSRPANFSSWSEADLDELVSLYLERVDRGPPEDEAAAAAGAGPGADPAAGRALPGEDPGDPAAPAGDPGEA